MEAVTLGPWSFRGGNLGGGIRIGDPLRAHSLAGLLSELAEAVGFQFVAEAAEGLLLTQIVAELLQVVALDGAELVLPPPHLYLVEVVDRALTLDLSVHIGNCRAAWCLRCDGNGERRASQETKENQQPRSPVTVTHRAPSCTTASAIHRAPWHRCFHSTMPQDRSQEASAGLCTRLIELSSSTALAVSLYRVFLIIFLHSGCGGSRRGLVDCLTPRRVARRPPDKILGY